MDAPNENGMEDSTGYDGYLGRFVDAVQADAAGYETLLAAWSSECPAAWRERFAADAGEIAQLIDAGLFVVGEDAA